MARCITCGHPGMRHSPNTGECMEAGCTCPGGDTHDPANPSCRYGQVAAVRPADLASDFYEDDEPVSKIMAIFDAGEKGVTAPPVRCRCGHGLDAHTGSFATGQHCKACPASRPCAGWASTAWTPDPVNAVPVTLAAARGALERVKQLEGRVEQLRELVKDLLHHTETWHHHPPVATCRKCIVQARARAALERPVAPPEDPEADHAT